MKIILILILLCLAVYWSSNIKEGSTDAMTVSGNVVTYNGKQYRTLTGQNPRSAGTNTGYCGSGGGSCVCENSPKPIPAGWKVADDTADSRAVIAGYNWNTDIIVLSTGNSYTTKNYIGLTPPGSLFSGPGMIGNDGRGDLRKSGNNVYAADCWFAVLLEKDVAPPPPPVKQKCPAGQTWQDGTGPQGPATVTAVKCDGSDDAQKGWEDWKAGANVIKKDGMCLQASPSLLNPADSFGWLAQMAPCDGGAAQKMSAIRGTEDGDVLGTITSQGRCLDVDAGTGPSVQLWTCNGSPPDSTSNQSFGMGGTRSAGGQWNLSGMMVDRSGLCLSADTSGYSPGKCVPNKQKCPAGQTWQDGSGTASVVTAEPCDTTDPNQQGWSNSPPTVARMRGTSRSTAFMKGGMCLTPVNASSVKMSPLYSGGEGCETWIMGDPRVGVPWYGTPGEALAARGANEASPLSHDETFNDCLLLPDKPGPPSIAPCGQNPTPDLYWSKSQTFGSRGSGYTPSGPDWATPGGMLGAANNMCLSVSPAGKCVPNCTCENGTAATGAACTKGNQCTSCKKGYVLKDGACVHPIPYCAIQKGSTCDLCKPGYHREASGGLIGSKTSTCIPNQCTCKNGTAATGKDCLKNDTNICTSCNKGFPGYILENGMCVHPSEIAHCAIQGGETCDLCKPGYHRALTLGGHGGSACIPNQCTCKNGTAATGKDCLKNDSNICSSCNSDYTLDNKECILNKCTCKNGTAATGAACTKNGANICSSCKTGYTGTQCSACSPNFVSVDDTCVPKIPDCTVQIGAICSKCKGGYTLEGNACTLNKCICKNGTAATGATCPHNGAKKCISCNDGYTGKECNSCAHDFIKDPHEGCVKKIPNCLTQSGTTCSKCKPDYTLNGNTCVLNKCTCKNGTPATVCTKNEQEQCASCKSGYKLSNKKCDPINYFGYYLDKPPMATENLQNRLSSSYKLLGFSF